MSNPDQEPDRRNRERKDVVTALGARLRQLRLDRGLSQEALAERAGISYKHVGEIERGDRNPSATSLVAVARGLGVTVGELFETVTPARVLSSQPRTIAALRESIRGLHAVLEELEGTQGSHGSSRGSD